MRISRLPFFLVCGKTIFMAPRADEQISCLKIVFPDFYSNRSESQVKFRIRF